MFSTFELENQIKKQIMDKLPNADLKKFNFYEGSDNSPEGIYIFMKNDKYHFLFSEKGKVRYDKELEDISEVIWYVLDEIVFDLAMDYAIKNRVNGEDFRRLLFKKEIEIYSLFGEGFKERKFDEIEDIIKNNPYCD